MSTRKFFVVRGLVFATLLGGAGIVIGFQYLNNYIYDEKQGDGTIEHYRATLEGRYICLDDVSDDCIKGLRTDQQETYALDFMLMSQLMPEIEIGSRIRAEGVVVPIEMLSTDHWQQYGIEGIFNITAAPTKL